MVKELSTKSGFKVVGGAIVPYADVSGTDKVTITVGSAKFRANVELSRKQFLATIVGDGLTYVKIPDNGIYYNVKHIGIVDYYVKYYYLDLTN